MAGRHFPAAPAALASATAGNASSSSGENSHLCVSRQLTAVADPGTRSGQPRPSEMGSFMSGGLACAIVEPSTNSTIEWITDCGCTMTSMSAYATPNSSCASITSSALLTIVAELIVTTGPMFQVGC